MKNPVQGSDIKNSLNFLENLAGVCACAYPLYIIICKSHCDCFRISIIQYVILCFCVEEEAKIKNRHCLQPLGSIGILPE